MRQWIFYITSIFFLFGHTTDGQSLFLDNLKNSVWVSKDTFKDTVIFNGEKIGLNKLNIPKDSLKTDQIIWTFKDDLIISHYNATKHQDSIIEVLNYEIDTDKGIIFKSDKTMFYDIGITSTGNFALLIRRNILYNEKSKTIDSFDVKKLLNDTRSQFIIGKVTGIKKGKYYLGRWHNNIKEDCYLLKVKVIENLMSDFRHGQTIVLVSHEPYNNGFIFSLQEQYLICYRYVYAEVNGKFRSLPWTWYTHTKKLIQSKEDIEQIKLFKQK